MRIWSLKIRCVECPYCSADIVRRPVIWELTSATGLITSKKERKKMSYTIYIPPVILVGLLFFFNVISF